MLTGRSYVFCLALVLAAPVLRAQQTTGTIRGVLTDDSGAVIPAAVVALSGNGAQRSVQTQPDGTYTFPGLMPGDYVIRVMYPGFTVIEQKLTLSAGQVQELPVQMKISSERQEVTVQAENGGASVSVEPDNNATSLTLRGEDLEALPDDPDDLQDALQALAGPGAGPNGGAIYIDGFSGGALPPKESIREVRVNQNPFSAEYDRLGFGRIEIFTKPGADHFRGALYFNDSDGVFNSRNPFSINKPDFSSRRYGVDFGGPINSRTSFFIDANRRNIDSNALVYAPNFVDPVTLATHPIQQSVVTPFVNTSIEPRIDYQISANNTLTARFEIEYGRRDNQGIGGYRLPPPYASLGYDSRSNGQDVTLSETAVLRPTMINETRFRYSRQFNQSLGSNAIPTINVAGAFTAGGNQTGQSYARSQQYEVQNSTSWSHGSHTVRWGIRLRRFGDSDYSPTGYGGTYSFLGGVGPVLDASFQPVLGEDGQPITAFLQGVEQYVRTLALQRAGYSPGQIRALGGGASRFTINAGNPYASISQIDASPWAQDDWRARPNLTVSLGLRYEAQTNAGGLGDFAPRIGIAWAPGSSGRGGQKTVIRAGAGLFYDRINRNLILNARRLNGSNQLAYVVYNPDYFPAIPPLSSLTPGQNTIQRISPDYRAGYSMQAAVGIERQLPRNTTLSVNYTYTRANHLQQSIPLNIPIPGAYPPGQPQLGVRPLGDAGNIFEYQSGGLMKQSLIMINFNTRFSRRVSLFGNYTANWAKDLPSQPSDPFNFSQDWGRSTLDRRHRFQMMGSVAGPLGLQINPFVVLQSGSPYDVLLGTDLYGDTLENERPAFAAPGAPNAVCHASIGCFAPPDPLAPIGLVPRNYLTSPGLISVNARLSRTFGFGTAHGRGGDTAGGPGPGGFRGGLGGRGGFGGGGPGPGFFGPSSERRYNLTLSVMVQNVLNHVNPGGFQGNINSPQFAQATTVNTGFGGGPGGGGAANNRRVELQARFTF